MFFDPSLPIRVAPSLKELIRANIEAIQKRADKATQDFLTDQVGDFRVEALQFKAQVRALSDLLEIARL